MKILIEEGQWTFDASAKTIVFADYATLNLERIMLITNVADNIIIYNPFDPAKGGVAATDTLTLDFDTTSMDDADLLQIIYDDATALVGSSDSLVQARLGAVDEIAPTGDTDTSALNGRLQLIAVRLSTVIGYGLNTLIGALTETAPSTDTASSGLNGRLQRIAQRASSIITQLGAISSDVSILNTIQSDTTALSGSAQVLGTATYTEASSIGITVGAVRRDADTTLVNNTNEFTPLQVDVNGRLKVEAFSGEALPITDNAGSLTVDAPTGTPVNVQIGNATLVAGVIDETGSGAVDALAVGGGTAHDAVDSGNPLKVGFKAASALPTAIAANDRANGISDLWGRQLVSHIDPGMQIAKNVNVTTTQTGTDVWDPAGGAKIAVTYLAVSAYATTAARVILWFGDNADTTYTAGTDQVLWAGSFAPSSTAKPMVVMTFPVPVFCTTADRELHLTTDAGISLDITVYGYEW